MSERLERSGGVLEELGSFVRGKLLALIAAASLAGCASVAYDTSNPFRCDADCRADCRDMYGEVKGESGTEELIRNCNRRCGKICFENSSKPWLIK